ncbi:hypothetical protein ACF1HJ_38280 [Streptomyces sp. NPDC013978]|uniref:hypothetical protein n=1 Tax=Streptomyces sp. NPDC013978 TaxID=3364869 RepID=UPI0036FF766D
MESIFFDAASAAVVDESVVDDPHAAVDPTRATDPTIAPKRIRRASRKRFMTLPVAEMPEWINPDIGPVSEVAGLGDGR